MFMVFCGIVCGLIGTAYPFALFVAAIKDGKNSSVNMASGLASILSSFLLLSRAAGFFRGGRPGYGVLLGYVDVFLARLGGRGGMGLEGRQRLFPIAR